MSDKFSDDAAWSDDDATSGWSVSVNDEGMVQFSVLISGDEVVLVLEDPDEVRKIARILDAMADVAGSPY